MEYARSRDGVTIAFERYGEGEPIVLIHGAAADHTRWASILSELKKKFTVYAIDRRGHGQSSDLEPYKIECEYDDVADFVNSINGEVNLLGHSYGAICSLEASLKISNLNSLILYEPPIPTEVKKDSPPDALERIKLSLRIGKNEKALLIFLKEIVGISEEEIFKLQSLPNWFLRVSSAHTIPREEESVRSYIFNPQRFSHMKTPTLLLLGGESPPFYRAAIEMLNKSLPKSRIEIMHKQRHAAMDTAPKLFLSKVIGFITEQSINAHSISL